MMHKLVQQVIQDTMKKNEEIKCSKMKMSKVSLILSNILIIKQLLSIHFPNQLSYYM